MPFYELLGLQRVAKPTEGVSATAGAWFEVPGGTQLHVSERTGARHPEQHFALAVDDLDALIERLTGAGHPWQDRGRIHRARRGMTADPEGNAVELTELPLESGAPVLVVTRFEVAEHEGEQFLGQATATVQALAARPGYLRGQLGRAADDPRVWVLLTEWDSVGTYRRSLSTYEVKVAATPLYHWARDEPSAFEVLLGDGGPGGSSRATDADRAAPGQRSAAVVAREA